MIECYNDTKEKKMETPFANRVLIVEVELLALIVAQESLPVGTV